MNGVKQGFLPVSKQDMDCLGWDELDFVYIVGDAYVDHPSFGHAIISRVLTAGGFRVGIISQPRWDSAQDFKKLGRPRLAVLISAGNLDSMVNHYTAAKKTRSDDMYSPGGVAHKRPDRATIVYANRIREAFGDIPIVIGGIEASLRRFAHYDYWSDRVRRSILIDSGADVLIYGMGEKQIMDVANVLDKGGDVTKMSNINGICYVAKDVSHLTDKAVFLPSFEEVRENKKSYAKAVKIEQEEQDPIRGKTLVQKHFDKYVVQTPPMMPLGQKELDHVYALPYTRTYHPDYEKDGGVPAITEVKFSLTSVRGCYGACNFCALTFHQGRIVQGRSHQSILSEAEKLVWEPDFKGYIHDVGGPTANFRAPACKHQLKAGACKNKQCLFPAPCNQLESDHDDYIALLRKLRQLPRVKKVFVRSGIRYDYLLADKKNKFLKELCEHHVSGQLKVAPEHISKNVLKYMGKPPKEVFDEFSKQFYEVNEKMGKKQFLVPYLMSSHPGSTLNDAIELALYLKKNNITPQQVQDFYPTPGTISTCMFYTGIDPRTGENVYVPKSSEDKAMQRALLQYKNPANYELVYKALVKVGRIDLIGFSPDCLIRPKRNATTQNKPNQHKGVKKNERKDTRRKSSVTKNQKRTSTGSGNSKRKGNHTGTGSHHRGR